jgi:hypothetical protein
LELCIGGYLFLIPYVLLLQQVIDLEDFSIDFSGGLLLQKISDLGLTSEVSLETYLAPSLSIRSLPVTSEVPLETFMVSSFSFSRRSQTSEVPLATCNLWRFT